MVCIGADPSELFSESGDLVYLGVKRIVGYPTVPVPEDVQQILTHQVSFLIENGEPLDRPALMKVCRNDIKYPHIIASNGTPYPVVAQFSKSFYKDLTTGMGDKAFYEAWMNHGEEYVAHMLHEGQEVSLTG